MGKRSSQLEMRMPDRNGQWRGGRRTPGKGKRLGRPPKGLRSSERHKRREAFAAGEPQHVTCRVMADLARLRKRHMYKAIRSAMLTSLVRTDFRIVHVSIQRSHVHFLVEAANKVALARGMQGLQISAARHINAAVTKRSRQERSGKVFSDRYHAQGIKSRRQARHALAYVLNNWRRHREDGGAANEMQPVDLFSSALAFDGWRDPDALIMCDPGTLEPLPVSAPRTWLLRVGWRHHGLIGTDEVPGPMPA